MWQISILCCRIMQALIVNHRFFGKTPPLKESPPKKVKSMPKAHGHLLTDICPRTFAHGYLPTAICPQLFAHGYLPTDICPQPLVGFLPWAFVCGQLSVGFWFWWAFGCGLMDLVGKWPWANGCGHFSVGIFLVGNWYYTYTYK